MIEDTANYKYINCKDNTDGNNVGILSTSCIAPPTTAKYYFISSDFSVIANCDSNCDECEKATDSDEPLCTNCKAGTFMRIDTDDCEEKCDSTKTATYYSYGKNTSTRKCEKCPLNADTR